MTITPYLYYEDLAGTMDWLARAFGLKRHGRAMKGPDGAVNHGAMKAGDGIVMMGRPGPEKKYRNPQHLGQATRACTSSSATSTGTSRGRRRRAPGSSKSRKTPN